MAANRDLPKLNSSCTTVVIARDGDGSTLRRCNFPGRDLVPEAVRVETIQPAVGSFGLRIHQEPYRLVA
jgi:hypothetical protein